MDNGQDAGQDTGTPLVDAAVIMGTTPAALRKRLQRGSVPGYKREGQWFVLVDSAHPTGSPWVAHGQDTALARTDDRRAADLAMILDRVAAVYEAQIAAQEMALAIKDEALVAKDETIATQRDALATQAETVAGQRATIAELRRRAEQAEAARDQVVAAQAAQDDPGTPEGPIEAPEVASGVWRRLRRWWGGT